jgi:hypothetical protein
LIARCSFASRVWTAKMLTPMSGSFDEIGTVLVIPLTISGG